MMVKLIKNKKGVGLAEVLVAGAVGGVIIVGSMKSLSLSMQSAQVARSSLSESDMRHSISQILSNTGDCLANFDPTPTPNTVPTDPEQAGALGLYGTNRDWAVGEVVRLAKTLGNSDNTDDVALLKKGVAFKGDLEIVQMELKGSLGDSPPNSDKTVLKKAVRNFVVYYKKVGMGGYSTLGGEPCTTSNKVGCYFSQCTVEYQRDDDGGDDSKPAFDPICSVSDCVSYGSGGGGANCYQVDKQDGTTAIDGRTLVGCGGTDKAKGEKTVAFGYNAGSSGSTYGKSTFIGYKAGSSTTTGYNNVLVGFKAGQKDTSGFHNTFIGGESGEGATTTGNHNTAIGFQSGRYIGSGSHNTLIGADAGSGITSGSHNIVIGKDVQVPSNTGSRQINIGNVVLGQAPSSGPTFNLGGSMSDGEVRVLGGPLKVCDSNGGNCRAVLKEAADTSCSSGGVLRMSNTGEISCVSNTDLLTSVGSCSGSNSILYGFHPTTGPKTLSNP